MTTKTKVKTVGSNVDVFAGVEARPYTPTGYITLDPIQLQELATLFGGSLIKNAEDLMGKLRRSQTVRFGQDLTFDLNTDDLWALRQQSIGMERPYEEYVKEFVQDAVAMQLNGFIGRR